jgi:hypothetical protein
MARIRYEVARDNWDGALYAANSAHHRKQDETFLATLPLKRPSCSAPAPQPPSSATGRMSSSDGCASSSLRVCTPSLPAARAINTRTVVSDMPSV